MSRILVTGSTDGVGRATAAALLDEDHDVVVHARSLQRLAAIEDLTARGARAVVGDLADPAEVEGIAEQAHGIGPVDAVIHNAGVIDGPDMLQVNVLAPYVLTAHVPASRLIYLSSSMHRGGRADLSRIDGSGAAATYSDSKLFVRRGSRSSCARSSPSAPARCCRAVPARPPADRASQRGGTAVLVHGRGRVPGSQR
ncbi:SDR family NAD(P)-dependent oxidoreductase [Brachybacterium hainanense]|uniref:SDR family NAD(P)-dependent oxidoreductase n=1 Tax=Brachybacterium hainanense TaxID=1541174 RepID=A0ABV6REM9_9MICO